MKAVLASLFVALACFAASATPLPPVTGKVILTVTGSIDNTNADGAALFDLAMLDTLERRDASIDTPWTNGAMRFEGPLLKALLDAVGAHGKTLLIRALNDYSAEVPIEDATRYETLLATRMNGKPMAVRDKGPIFLIYPFDTEPELYNEKYFSRSVWQIKEIEVLP